MQLTGIERSSQFALVAAEQAVEDAHLVLNEAEQLRSGVYIGCCQGEPVRSKEGYIEVFRRNNPRIKPLSVCQHEQRAASHLSIKYHLQGRTSLTPPPVLPRRLLSAEPTANQVRLCGCNAGRVRSFTTLGVMKGWEALRTLALEDPDVGASCKPFAKNRTGLVLGEGAAVLVLEDADRVIQRGVKIYAELIGYDC